MAIQATQKSSCQIDLDHAEVFVRGVSELCVAPLRNTLYYFFPFFAAYSSNATQLREGDLSQESMYPSQNKDLILKEIKDLTAAAGIKRNVNSYGCLTHNFLSSGGSLSLTSPSIFLPHHHLFRPGKSPFTQERVEDDLKNDIWHFTDDETRFLISRELALINENDALLRIVVKVVLLAAAFIIYATPIGWLGGLGVAILGISIYIFSEKIVQRRIDLKGITITASRLDNDFERAKNAALSSLEKMREQNLFRRNTNRLARVYTTKLGNNVLDFNHPFLSSRIEYIQPFNQ